MSVFSLSHVVCPHCGKSLAKGSTFCINCGNRLPDNLRQLTSEADSLTWNEPGDSSGIPTSEEEPVTPLDSDATLGRTPTKPKPHEEPVELPPVELTWDDVEKPIETSQPTPEPTTTPLSSPPLRPIDDSLPSKDSDMSWEEPVETSDAPKVGDPFEEVEPPKVVSEESMPFKEVEPPKVVDGIDTTTDDATTHLFPEGRSDTTPDFIDAVVGEAEKIGISTPMRELETPSCPNCGEALTGDDFEYPEYVFSAMGKARLDHGIELLNNNHPQEAIESFEQAKKLYERANDDKMIDVSIKKIDEGYDAMGHSHFELGERHLKAGEFEWAIVQFRKAREIYMLSTDKKLRAKCAERIRISYLVWGKSLEDEADNLSKQGDVRTALERYRQAAEKYREGGDEKKLKGLEKKIRKA
jgi:hypothetical protein